MKKVLISIHPKWCELIFSGEKTIEVRKTAPKCYDCDRSIIRPPQSWQYVEELQ